VVAHKHLPLCLQVTPQSYIVHLHVLLDNVVQSVLLVVVFLISSHGVINSMMNMVTAIKIMIARDNLCCLAVGVKVRMRNIDEIVKVISSIMKKYHLL
jgi:hypothetical protein